MSVVCLAEDLRDGSRWAIKFLPPALRDDPWRAECLRREYRLARGFSHPSLVRLRDLVRQDDQDYLVLEAIDGTRLRELLDARRLPIAEAIETGKAIAGALHYIHESDRRNWLIHGDVKPENVLIRRGEGPIVSSRVVLIDFGTMTVAARTMGGAGWLRRLAWNLFGGQQLVGCSSLYVSPEQATGRDLDPRADVYSMGAVLYELLAGRPPFLTDAEERAYAGHGTAFPEHPLFLHRHLDRELLQKHVSVEPHPPSHWNPDLPPDLSRLVMRCLAKSPEDRFPDMLSPLMELTQMKVDADGTFRNARRTTGRTTALHARPAVVLRVVSGPQRGLVARLERGIVQIGRAPSGPKTIQLTEDRDIADTHATVQFFNGSLVLTDLGGPSGTTVNGQRVSGRYPLKAGDRIGVGQYTIAIEVGC